MDSRSRSSRSTARHGGALIAACLAIPCALSIAASAEIRPGKTQYGFFFLPGDPSPEGIEASYRGMGGHADFVLLQLEPPWEEFSAGAPGDAPAAAGIRAKVALARRAGLEPVFVLDPLDGLDRREFARLPGGWEPSFGDPRVRRAFLAFAEWIAREFAPRRLGLGSEINSYADAHPEDFPRFLALYRDAYGAVKRLDPGCEVFATFQWEELNNLVPGRSAGAPFRPSWPIVEAFEPRLDIWAVSTYPAIAFRTAEGIPDSYYSALRARTSKPVAVAESGWPAAPAPGGGPGSAAGQAAFLRAVRGGLGGPRLAFWAYLLYRDLDDAAYAAALGREGRAEAAAALRPFARMGMVDRGGAPRPALAAWDAMRTGE